MPKLHRLERFNETTGETSTVNYTYDNNLLTTISSGESEYRYSYTNGTITTAEIWSGERLITRYTYTIDNDTQVTVAQYVFDNGNETLLRVEERQNLGNSVLRYNFYSFPGGEKTLEYYIQKTVIAGNVTMEQSFDANGVSRDKISTWKFGEAINPLSYVSGNVSSRNQNLATNHNFLDEGTLTIQQTHVIETNEFKLPVQISSILRNSLFGDQRVIERYFYE
ncbi:MAG: hypothetical protein Roseis2KO_19930 [Roseivirga sp.]